MIADWHLRHALVNCQNDDDCGYCGYLEEFVDLDSDDYPVDEEFVLEGVCPKCGQPVRLTIEPHIDFYVWEEKR